MKGVAGIDELAQFVGSRRVERSADYERIVRHHANRIAVEAREASDQRTAEIWRDFEEGIAVQNQFEHAAGVVTGAPIMRNQIEQFLFAPIRIVLWFSARRHLPNVLRQIRKEAANLREGVVFALCLVINRSADIGVNMRSAEILLGQILADTELDHRRSGDEELARPAHHHGEMRSRHAGSAEAGDRTHASGDDRHLTHQTHGDVKPRHRGNVGCLYRLESADRSHHRRNRQRGGPTASAVRRQASRPRPSCCEWQRQRHRRAP